ncbi:MAG: DNA-protecting protein DprA [Bacteroidales bacterium]|nr:DNA-protecting protein DprA [Bacteroidales bacterium]MCB9014038.1 DNA-protecting protein DprA [Bacteroidales bacterium]
MNKESAYWIALAHLPRWGHLKINNLIIKFYHENKLSIEDFFQLSENDWKNQYGIEYKEVEDLKRAKSELANNAFLAESLNNEGYELIPIISPEYSKTLKDNLKAAHAPALLYVKGNKQIMKEKSIAIVGSRNATDKSLEFTDNIAKLASKEYKVVVSGFAKGVDKQALDSAINYKGQSIIVLPQGIMTFGSGFKKYYKQIVDGDVLVLSTFFPKAPWKAELAMARNPIIYGLASEIYVAESSDKGGTWSGVVDGLRKNRKIYVRKPDANENNANNLLIQKGAIAVDFNGNSLLNYKPLLTEVNKLSLNEPTVNYEIKILDLLKTGEYAVKEIIKKLLLTWSEKKLREFLKSKKEVETINKKPLRYTMKDSTIKQRSLFD